MEIAEWIWSKNKTANKSNEISIGYTVTPHNLLMKQNHYGHTKTTKSEKKLTEIRFGNQQLKIELSLASDLHQLRHLTARY